MSNLFRLLAPKPRTIERDQVTIELPDGRWVDVERVRHPRARRLRLSVDERGARLTLPMRASLVSGDRFLREHRHWLAAQLDHYAPGEIEALARDVTASLPLRGQTLPLRWQQGRFTHLAMGDHGVLFTVSPRATGAALQRALRDFYEAQARTDLARWLPNYLPSLPRAPSRIVLKRMSSQWGSLSPEGAMALDLSLVLARPSAFEYVLVHELCHLVRADHSRAFWREVETRFPAWRDERDYFRLEGRQLKARLRALTSGSVPA
ncbi:MAG: SprT family zinc-dependent metalloprotease [Luteimonas sp.]